MTTRSPDSLAQTKNGSLPNRKVRVLGIDLGTTNSTASQIIWDPAEPNVPAAQTLEVEQPTLEGAYTHTLVPSVVALHNDRVFVGEGARRLRARASELGLERGRNIFYECKNEIGIRKTYHRAPEGYRSAAEIGGHVVRFLIDAALADDPTPIDRVVVTVPASFQVAQRNDTIMAMRLAGLEVEGGDIIDEPVAAFLDYLTVHGREIAIRKPTDLLVFDFGGGTCDVAVLRVGAQSDGGGLEVAPKAVSRYHRLGGGDIDRAIVYGHLLPMLKDQNELGEFYLPFEAKKNVLEPFLLDLAEGLKTSLSSEIRQLESFDKYEEMKDELDHTLPDTRTITVDGRELHLSRPALSALEFEELLAPFLDQDLLYPSETEYVLTSSIFAPLTDALDRSGLDADAIDLALLVGGSSLIPQVSRAVAGFLPGARVLSHQHHDDVKACVSRGAAYQAMSLALFGEGQVQPICPESLAIQTAKGPVELVAAGARLPFPENGEAATNTDLRAPSTNEDHALDLRVQVISGSDHRELGREVALIRPPVNKGDMLKLHYRLDENQTLQLSVTHQGENESQSVEMEFHNPLTNVVNPQTTRIRIEDTEEELRTNPDLTRNEKLTRLQHLGDDYAELGQREKALAYLMTVLRAKARPDGNILNKMAIICGEMGDTERQEKFYLESAKASPRWGGALFNLSLALERRGEVERAAASVEKAIERGRDPAYLVQRASLANRMDDTSTRDSLLAEAITAFGPPRTLDNFDLGWLIQALRIHGDRKALKAAEAERKSRARSRDDHGSIVGELPDIDVRQYQ